MNKHWAEETAERIASEFGATTKEAREALFVEAMKWNVALGAMTLEQANAELAPMGLVIRGAK